MLTPSTVQLRIQDLSFGCRPKLKKSCGYTITTIPYGTLQKFNRKIHSAAVCDREKFNPLSTSTEKENFVFDFSNTMVRRT